MTKNYISIAAARDHYLRMQHGDKVAEQLILRANKQGYVLFPRSPQEEHDFAKLIDPDLLRLQYALHIIRVLLYQDNGLDWKLCTQHSYSSLEIDPQFNSTSVINSMLKEAFLMQPIEYGYSPATILVSKEILGMFDVFLNKRHIDALPEGNAYNVSILSGKYVAEKNQLIHYCMNNLDQINQKYNTHYTDYRHITIKVLSAIVLHNHWNLPENIINSLKIDLGKA